MARLPLSKPFNIDILRHRENVMLQAQAMTPHKKLQIGLKAFEQRKQGVEPGDS
jgi:hypothetical protein